MLSRVTALGVIIAAIGLPINNPWCYGLFVASVLVIFTGQIRTTILPWLCAIALGLVVLGQKVFLSPPRIDESHNAFLIDGPGSAIEEGLPNDAFRVMSEQFHAAYPPAMQCRRGELGCWRNEGVPNRLFAFAADGFFDRGTYSRRVTDINFRSALWLRIGFVNDASLSFFYYDRPAGPHRYFLNPSPLAVLDRTIIAIPYFVMYQLPRDFVGSRLCWQGGVLWERQGEQFDYLQHNRRDCHVIQDEDVGRRIIGLSIERNAQLAMSLDASWSVIFRKTLAGFATLTAVLGILMVLVRWQLRRMIFPLVLVSITLVVVLFVDASLVGGFRPLDGDGLAYTGQARQIVHALMAWNFETALLGGSKVFFYVPGMRYFRAIEFIVFGDTTFGYLSAMLVMPLLVYAVSARFMGIDWAIIFTLGFVAMPLGMLFGTSFIQHVLWAARGFADPLAVVFFLAGLSFMSGRSGDAFFNRSADAFWSAFLLALAVDIRPNLAPGVAPLLGSIGLIALRFGEYRKLLALCLGFLPIFLPLWHNWFFGGVLVPFTISMTTPLNYVTPPSVYWYALGEVIQLQFSGEYLMRVVRHVGLWLAGPAGFSGLVPLHLIATAIIFRVACARRFDVLMRLVALAIVALTILALIYVVWQRYHLLVWLLMAVVVAAWIREEGLPTLGRHNPTWLHRLEHCVDITRIPYVVTQLRRICALGEAKTTVQPNRSAS